MAPNHKADEANKLARELAELTGEDLNAIVASALRRRLARDRSHRVPAAELPARLSALARRLRTSYDTRPVSRSEWNEASGEEG